MVVVGAGPGGLCAAMLLAARGIRVTVLERLHRIGGRSGSLKLGAYRFDLGSTMLMMRFVLEEMFELVGQRLEDELEMVARSAGAPPRPPGIPRTPLGDPPDAP